MDAKQTIDAEKNYLVQTYARPPFVLTRGEGVYVFDANGKKYLDCAAGIAVNALGYSNPELIQYCCKVVRMYVTKIERYHTTFLF